MWYTVPIEDLLLLLSTNAVVLVHKVQKWTFWLLEGGICSGLQITQVRENSFLEFLGVLDWSPESLEAKGQATDNIRARDVEQIIPV